MNRYENSDGLTVGGTVSGVVENYGAFSAGAISGTLYNVRGEATVAGTVAGDVFNYDNGYLSAGAVSGNLANSGSATVNGDVGGEVANSGNLTITGTVSGSLANSGAASVAGDVGGNTRNDGSLTIGGAVIGDLTNTGAAAVSGSVGGDVTNSGSAAVAGLISGDVTNTGSLLESGGIAGTLTNNGSVQVGAGGESLATVVNNGSVQLGSSSNPVNVSVGNASGNGQWVLPVNSDTGEKSTLTVGTATGNATIVVNASGDGSLDPNTVLAGAVSGLGTENWKYKDFDWGLDEYSETADGTFTKSGVSSLGGILASGAAVQQGLWLAEQNSLVKRMGDLRLGALRQADTGKPDGSTKSVIAPRQANSLVENVWVRSYGQQLNVSPNGGIRGYEQLIYGVDLGADKEWRLDPDNLLYTGFYAGYGSSDLDYRVAGSKGSLDSYYGGFYATWLHESGWYADVTLKAASVDHDLTSPYGLGTVNAKYNNVNVGGSVEVGKRVELGDGWFAEPQAQINYLHILASDYRADNLDIAARDMDALQFRVGGLVGKRVELKKGGVLQFYVKASGVETVSNGGEIGNGSQWVRANLDGARAEVGVGVVWEITDRHQLHLDFESSFGDKYDKPWGVNFGYRFKF